MPGLSIRNIPPGLHAKLKREATRHRRSITQEVLHILENAVETLPAKFPRPVSGKSPLTQDLLKKGIKGGRS